MRTYKLDGKTVAKNRKPRCEQVNGKTRRQSYPALSDLTLTNAELSRLQVTKSTRYKNDTKCLLPGTVFEYEGGWYIRTQQITNGKYYRAFGDDKTNYPVEKCRILCRNAGLVFL